MKISGPSLWLRYSFDGRNIDMFGERHEKKRLCEDGTDMVDFLENICAQYYDSQKQLDIFLESPFSIENGEVGREVFYDSSPLIDVRRRFSFCLRENKEECPYLPYVRFHYSDIRFASSVPTSTKFKVFLAENYVQDLENIIRHLENDKQEFSSTWLNNIYNTIYDVTLFSQIDAYFDAYLVTDKYKELLEYRGLDLPLGEFMVKRIKKQLSAVPEYKNCLFNYFRDQTNRYFVNFRSLIDSEEWTELLENKSIKTLRDNIEMLIRALSFLIDIDSGFMDIYTMARVLRTFQWSENNDIIILAGAAHIYDYQGFFHRCLGLIPEASYGDLQNQCISGAHVERIWGAPQVKDEFFLDKEKKTWLQLGNLFLKAEHIIAVDKDKGKVMNVYLSKKIPHLGQDTNVIQIRNNQQQRALLQYLNQA